VTLPICGFLARGLGAGRYRRIVLVAAGAPLAMISIKWLIERVFAVGPFTIWGM
jgi:hypothetical protein